MPKTEIALRGGRPNATRLSAAGLDETYRLDRIGAGRAENPLPERQKSAVWRPGRPIDVQKLIVSGRFHLGLRPGKLTDKERRLAVEALADERQPPPVRRPSRRPIEVE